MWMTMYFPTPQYKHSTLFFFLIAYSESWICATFFSFIGYEKYNTIRADPALCFLERVGKPDEKAVAAEQRANDYIDGYEHLKAGMNVSGP